MIEDYTVIERNEAETVAVVEGSPDDALPIATVTLGNLQAFVDRLAGNLSGGMKQKLGLACVLVHEPGLLILDEPTNGVDPVSRREFWDILQNMKEAGMTLLVSTAYLDEGETCDRLALMHAGVILAQNHPAAIRGAHDSLEAAVVLRIREADKELAHDLFSL